MKNWVKDFHCYNCGSSLALKIETCITCFICEQKANELKEAVEEGEDFPELMAISGRVDQIISLLNTPSNIMENNLIDERYEEFISIVGILEDASFVDINSLLEIARKIRNAKERKRKENRRNLSKGNKRKASRLSLAA